MKENAALLIGNGINRINKDGISWKDVLGDISKNYNIGVKEIDNKPFPLVYDEILLQNPFYYSNDICNLRRFITLTISKMAPNYLHAKVVRKKISNIITTNYDHCLEKCSGSIDENNSDKAIEKKYSLYRRNTTRDATIWHIHGDLSNPRSIQLGYNDYGSALTQIQNYLNNPKKRTNPESYLINPKLSYKSWIDVFFRNKIHIIGLELDFSEIDLWWLLIKKQYYLQKNRHQYYPGIPDDPDTFYYYPYIDDMNPQQSAKISLLESIGINVFQTRLAGTWEYSQYYEDIFNSL